MFFKKNNDIKILKFKNIKEIKVLGSGCARCQALEHNVKEALKSVNLNNVLVTHITDYEEIAKYGVMSTPALVIDEEVKSTGALLNKNEIIKLLSC